MVLRNPRTTKEKSTMNVAHKAQDKREISLDDLQSNFAVMVNNAIPEGRESAVPVLVREYRATRPVPQRTTVKERIRAFFA